VRLALLAVAALLPLLSGCVPLVAGAGAVGAYSTLEDRRPTSVQLDDGGISKRAASRISDRYGEQVHVNVTSYNRSVLLTGEVPDAAIREDVERVTRAVPGVRNVSNELEIAGNSSLTARTNDSLITSKVKGRFLDAQRFNPVHVSVVTEAGTVYLLGIVTEQEAEDATELSRTLAGVRKVVKIFEYCQPTDAVCVRKQPDARKPAAAR
jgi:osmotically-inducible protein OsmY